MKEITFSKAKYSKRVLSFLFDLLVTTVSSLVLMTGFHKLDVKSDSYIKHNEVLMYYDRESGLYDYNDSGSYVLITKLTQYCETDDTDYASINLVFDETLSNFYSNPLFFNQNDPESGIYLYKKDKLDSKGSDGNPLFVYQDDLKTSVVQSLEASPKELYNFYKNQIEYKAVSYFLLIDDYVDASKSLYYRHLWIELILPISICIAIFFLVFPLIFSRGKQTLGKKIFKIGFVDKYGLSPTNLVYLVSFMLFLVIELGLSLVSFGIPLIVSFSMFVFSKDNKTFSQYVTNLYSVDCTTDSIYKSQKEFEDRQKQLEKIDITNKTFSNN